MKLNTESTTTDRLRLVIGAILGFAGVVTLTIVGAIYSYTNMTVWIFGLALLVIGLLIAKSTSLIHFLVDITR